MAGPLQTAFQGMRMAVRMVREGRDGRGKMAASRFISRIKLRQARTLHAWRTAVKVTQAEESEAVELAAALDVADSAALVATDRLLRCVSLSSSSSSSAFLFARLN